MGELIGRVFVSKVSLDYAFYLFRQDRLATDAWKIIAALKKEKGDLEVGNHICYCFHLLTVFQRIKPTSEA